MKNSSWMTTAEVAEQFGVASQTILDWSRAGTIPQPRRFSTRTLRWRTAEITDYIQTMPRGIDVPNTQV